MLREPAIKSRIEAMQITMQIVGPDVQRKFLADQMKLWGRWSRSTISKPIADEFERR